MTDENGILKDIEEFLKGTSDDVETTKTGKVLLLAMRLDRKERRGEYREITNALSKLSLIVFGTDEDHTKGLEHKVDVLDRFRKNILRILAVPAVAFLGAVGAWFWDLLAK